MSRHIDADKVMAEIAKIGGHNLCEWETIGVKALIDRQPTADVVEIRHGYWKWEKKIEPQAQNRLYCSICDNECLSKGNYYVYSTYCPNCGAKMDGERSENET